ncbi:MAG: YceI family protein [Flavobacteriaceae bacterium]|nr:YceI family protein [Flavobacteriaceae bacterium]
MKKVVISLFVLAITFTACKDSGKKIETKEAQEVEIVKKAETVTFDKVKEGSELKWRASHLGGTGARFGKAKLKSGNVLLNNNKVTNAKFIMDLSSLTVDNFDDAEQKGQLEGHLKSADFFNIEKYPTVIFELTKVEETKGVYNSKITGNLTILETTKSITFNANITVLANSVAISSEDFSVNRQDWKLSYHTEGDAGVPKDYLIANTIGFTIDVAVTK